LSERVRIARAAKADLLISIHADTISGAPQFRGLTVYTGSERASDAESAQVADRENKADAVAGLESEDAADEGVADILQDLIRRETRGFSHAFAGKMIRELSPVMKLNVKPHREARFVVLRAPDVPAVLVELGYLSSSKDTDLLTSDQWRDRMTASMSGAIDRFFATRLAKQGTAPVSP
jgi:N-acetylmuramoyl-L-alanine amidase